MKESKENNYKLCYENLCKEFAKYNPEEMAKKSRANYDSEKEQFTLTYLGKEYLIFYPEGKIVLKDGSLSTDDNRMFIHKMLILSYLFRAANSGLANKWVPLRDLEGIGHAYQGFAQQGIDRLVKFFGHKGDLFLKAGLKLGGKKADMGDMGVEINVFPNVPMILGLWLADDEFEANAVILFDSSAPKEVHIEDLAGLCSIVADEVVIAAKSIK